MVAFNPKDKTSRLLRNNLIVSPIHAQSSAFFATNTQSLLYTYNDSITRIASLSTKANTLTQQRLAADPNYTLGRGIAVKLAWKYEVLDFKLGGRGTERWMRDYKDEILQTGKVKGAQGHHRKNVADHPYEQSNPNNIKFFRNGEEHLQKGHGGDFHNESDMEPMDRTAHVRSTRNKSIMKNEAYGVGISAIIGFGTAASMSFILELSKNGISYESLQSASQLAVQNGAMGAGYGAASYLIYRGVGVAADYALKGRMAPLSNVAKGSIAGIILIAGTSAYGYQQMRNEGYTLQHSLMETGKQAVFPTSSLLFTLYLPEPFGAIAGASSFLLYMGYNLFSAYQDNKVSSEINKLQMERLYEKAKRSI